MFVIYKMPYNEAIKNNIMKWRETHKDDYNAYMLSVNKTNYWKNPEEKRKYRMKIYYYNKESQIFRNILLS